MIRNTDDLNPHHLVDTKEENGILIIPIGVVIHAVTEENPAIDMEKFFYAWIKKWNIFFYRRPKELFDLGEAMRWAKEENKKYICYFRE
jgi:hypothetical protein